MWTVTAAMKLKDVCYLEGQHIKKQRLHFVEMKDREAWRAAVPGLKKVGHDLATTKTTSKKCLHHIHCSIIYNNQDM